MHQSRPIPSDVSAPANAQTAQQMLHDAPSTSMNSQAAGPLKSPIVNGSGPSHSQPLQSSRETRTIPASSSAMDFSSARPQPLILTSSSGSTDSPQPLPSPSTSSSGSSSPTEIDAKAGTSRLHTLKTEANSQASSPSSSRHSTPSLSVEAGVGATRRKDERKVLPRNIDRVFYGDFEIKTWYYSPYPLEDEHPANGNSHASASTSKSKAKAKARQSGVKADKSAQPAPSPTPTQPSTPSAETSSSSSFLTAKPPPQPKTSCLWICEGCFKYMRTHTGWYAHKHTECSHQHPPGRKVYQRGAHTIWEVDGAKQKLYAQNLSLFGKLFIDHKTIFFDVEPFNFYVMTDGSAKFDLALGYFSKEKHSYDNYNLACITTFPPYQKKGYGTLMIEFSYLLSSRAGVLGTPERPLSDLGFKGYVAHWSAVLLRTLALAFDEDHPDVVSRLVEQSSAALTVASSVGGSSPPKPSRYQKQMAGRIKALLLGVQDPTETQLDTIDTSLLTTDERQELKRLKKSANGWTGEKPPALLAKLATLASSPGRPKAQDQDVSAVIKTPLKRKEAETASPSSDSKRKLSISPTASLKRKSPEEDGYTMPPPTSAPPASTSTHIRTGPDRAARHATPTHRSASPVATFSSGKSTNGKANGAATANGDGKESAATATHDPPAPTPTQLQVLSSDSAAPVAFTTTLERISKATGLRPDDAVLALSECGLLKTKCLNNAVPVDAVRHAGEEDKEQPTSSATTATTGPVLLITREAVRNAIVARNVKRPVLELQYAIWEDA